MRVAFYTQTAYFESALLLAAELSKQMEFHLLLELAPGAWRSGMFDVGPKSLPSGLTAGDPILKDLLEPAARACWQAAASFSLVVHNQRRSLHPASWWVSRQAVRFMRRLEPDVIHVDDQSLRLALAVGALGPSSLVVGIHDPLPHSGEQNWRDEFARWRMFPRVDHFVLRSQALVDGFCRRYRLNHGRVGVVPLGVYSLSREWSIENPGDGPPTVLFFGRQSHYKGLEVLYRAAPRVAARVPGVRFVIAGKPVAGYLPPAPPRLSNGARVEVINSYLSNRCAAELFQRATVVVCPYTDATQSGVVLSAYAFDKPIIAAAVGGLPEYVRDGETGLLVPPADPEALASALVAVLTEGELRARLSQGVARLAAGNLSWASIAQQMTGLYAQVLAPPQLDSGHGSASLQSRAVPPRGS